MSNIPDSLPQKEQTLKGRLVVITGATRGIGLAITLALAARGCNVLGTYVNSTERASALTELLPGSHFVVADISEPSKSIPAITAALEAHFPDRCVDILVHNAYYSSLSLLADLTEEDLWKAGASNIVFPVMLTKALLPVLSKSGTGRIVSISSEATHAVRPGSTVYSAAKACLESWTRTWAVELGQQYNGLTANAVAPGMMETDLWRALPADRRAVWEERFKNTPAGGRIGQPDDVAGVVEWLVSDGGRWVTGATVPVNGGAVPFC